MIRQSCVQLWTDGGAVLPRNSWAGRKGKRAMPIRPYLDGEYFEPEAIENMGIAFERVCEELGLREKDDPLNRFVARAIIEKAQAGIHDAIDLAMAVLIELRSARRPSPPALAKPHAWNAMDDFYLRNEVKIGRRTEKIAEALGREVDEVRKRAGELGLGLPDER
jgi:hypothetical protein